MEPSAAPKDTPAPYPILGVFAVLLGASLATFFGRLLSVGLPDLRGALAIDSDTASWIGTSYNMGMMFIGPFSVYLGGILGPRRVLLWAAGILAVACFLMPFSAHTGVLLGMLAIAGVAAGTFYPLTLTIVLRNLPLSYVHYGIAAYVFDIIATTHIAHAYEGWVMRSLSWEWLFWTIALLSPVMIALVVFGIAKHPLPKPKPGEEPPSWAGFLYASVGGALLYAALDQGQRLDWWSSGVFVSLLTVGTLLLLAAIWRHLVKPNPLVDLAFLWNRNTIFLGMTIFCFRYVLLSSVVLVPSYLSTIQNYRPEQTGNVLLWLAIPEILAGTLAVYLLGRVDIRLILATGFTLITIGCLMDSRISTLWSGNDFYLSQFILSLGLGLAFNGMAGSIILNALSAGATKKASSVLTYSGYFHTVRLLGGQLGISSVQYLLHNRQVFHYDVIASGIQPGTTVVAARATILAAAVHSQSPATDIGALRSVQLFGSSVAKQAFTLSIMDSFTIATYAAIIPLILVAFFTPMKIGLKQIIDGSAGKMPS